MRKLLFVSRDRELANIQKLAYNIKRGPHREWIDKQTLMVMVSPDFSGIVTTILAQAVSPDDGEMMYVDVIHVPDPDEDRELFKTRFRHDFPQIQKSFEAEPMTKFILVEAGIISGRNYTWVVEEMMKFGVPRENIITVALFQNIHSAFECDYVGEYYDDTKEDLCFWWEKPNSAFGDFSENSSS